MWLSAVKLALNAGTHIYKKRQETKMAMADAQHMAAQKMARGETEYQGKLLEARQNDYKDEGVLLILTLPILVLAYGVWSDDPAAMENERKKQEMQKRQEIDQAKLVQNRDINEDKLEQNEGLAELRADTSIEKQEMANENRLTLAKMKPKSINK